jgi:hypothetical protein
MQYLLGALGAAAFFVCLFMAYTYGQMRGPRKAVETIVIDARDEAELEDVEPATATDVEEQIRLDEQRKRARELTKGFNELMGYTTQQAIRGKQQ